MRAMVKTSYKGIIIAQEESLAGNVSSSQITFYRHCPGMFSVSSAAACCVQACQRDLVGLIDGWNCVNIWFCVAGQVQRGHYEGQGISDPTTLCRSSTPSSRGLGKVSWTLCLAEGVLEVRCKGQGISDHRAESGVGTLSSPQFGAPKCGVETASFRVGHTGRTASKLLS